MYALSSQKQAEIHPLQKDNFFTVKELGTCRTANELFLQHKSTTDNTGSVLLIDRCLAGVHGKYL